MLASDSASVSNPSGTSTSTGSITGNGADLRSVEAEDPPYRLAEDACRLGVTPGVLPETCCHPDGMFDETVDSSVAFDVIGYLSGYEDRDLEELAVPTGVFGLT